MRHVVKSTFIDKETGKGYTKGGMFESDDSERIAFLVKGGFLVGVVEESDSTVGGVMEPVDGQTGEILPDGGEQPEEDTMEVPPTEDEQSGEDDSETPPTDELPKEEVVETASEESEPTTDGVEPPKPKRRGRSKKTDA